ncbi:hypothetical protein ACOSOMT5_P2467 [Acidiphilium sp. MT5]
MFDGLADSAGYRFLPDDPPSSVEGLRARYVVLAGGSSADGSEIWHNWVIRCRNDHNLLGYTQATVQGPNAMVGYHVFPSHWRQGYATEAMMKTLDMLFAMPSIDQANAFVDTRNVASISLLKRLGFTVERMIENADFFKGSQSDEFEFRLSRGAWAAHSLRERKR